MTFPLTPALTAHVADRWMPNALLAGESATVQIATLEQLIQARDTYDETGNKIKYDEVMLSLLAVRAARAALYEAMALD